MKKMYFILLSLALASVSFAQNSTVKFQAAIENRNGDVLYIREGKNIIKEIKADSKGAFKDAFEVKEGLYQMFDGVEYAQLYLKNGFDLKLKMDAKQFDQTIKFSGKGAAENNFLAQYMLADGQFDYNTLLASDETTFNKLLNAKSTAELDKLKDPKLDPAFVSTLTKTLEMSKDGLKKYYYQKLEASKMNNSMAPNFDYESAAGGKVSLESLKGKYVYIDVWATWCGPCRQELPFLKQVEEKYREKNIAFVSISTDAEKDHDKWKKFVADKDLQGIQLYADKSFDSEFIKAFGINSIPRFILIDPSGKVLKADANRPSDPKLQEEFDALLK